MKTPINLADYDFQTPIFKQISDDPVSKMARVIGYFGDSLDLEFTQIILKAKTFYINLESLQIAKQLTHPTYSKNQPWVINNNYQVMLLSATGQPIENADFNSDEEISLENLPYKTQKGFDRFSSFMLRRQNPVSLPLIWDISVESDDALGYFDAKDYHLTIVDVQKQIFEKIAK
jgi:hypothetical protein